MVADGRASSVEKKRIIDPLQKAGAAWDANYVSQKIDIFIKNVQTNGFKSTLESSLSGVSLFQAIDRPEVLLKCVDLIVTSDREISENEKKLLILIRQRLDSATSSAVSPS